MEDFFLQYSKGMSKENLSMRKAALAAMPSGPDLDDLREDRIR